MPVRHVPFDCTPEYLKEKTDAALSLLNEINETDMDENKMKPREVKGVEQVRSKSITENRLKEIPWIK